MAPHLLSQMETQEIVNDLLAQGQNELTPELQDRITDIITGKINRILLFLLSQLTYKSFTHYRKHNNIPF